MSASGLLADSFAPAPARPISTASTTELIASSRVTSAPCKITPENPYSIPRALSSREWWNRVFSPPATGGAARDQTGRLAAVNIKIEVLFSQLVIGAVRAHLGERFVQGFTQFVVFFTQAHTGTDAKEFFVLNGQTAELVIFTHRLFQEAFACRHFILECRVNTACREVCVDVFLALVRDNFNPLWRPVLVAVGFLRRTLQHAHAFAFQRFEGWLNVRGFGHHQTGICRVEFVRKGNLLLTFLCDGQ